MLPKVLSSGGLVFNSISFYYIFSCSINHNLVAQIVDVSSRDMKINDL
jgi:hypothetical protein